MEASQIDRAKYEAELDTAWQELDRLHKHIDEYADLFARIDQSEIDTLAQRAMDLFYLGQVDEAVRLFEQGNYLEKLKADNRIIQQADQLIESAEQGKAKAEKDKEEHLQSLNAQIAAYKMQNEWEKAGKLLKGLADELNTLESYLEYANFCQNQNYFDEAETYFLKALPTIQQIAANNPQLYMLGIATSLNDIAILYSKTQRFSESEQLFLEALEIDRHMTKSAFRSYKYNVAQTLNNLGALYLNTQRFSECEDVLLEAIEIYRQSKDDLQTYEHGLAMTLHNLASLYAETQRFSESEALFKEVVEIRKHQVKNNPQEFGADLAMALNNLAILYNDAQRFTESETVIMEAIELYRDLAKENPQAYEFCLASSINSLALLYYNTQRFSECETANLEAMKIRRRMASKNPQAYEPDLASTINNLANLYSQTRHLSESETLYMEALDIYSRLANDNLYVYMPKIANTLYNLGLLYLEKEQFYEAIPFFEDALEAFRILSLYDPSHIQLYIHSLHQLSQIYPMTEEFSKNYEINEEWLPLFKEFYLNNRNSYQEEYVNLLGHQSYLCIIVDQLIQSEQYAREALSIDSTQHWIHTNLAASLLFQGKYNEAEAIYRQYKDELKDNFLQDLDDFEAAGIITEERKADMERIKKILMEE